MPILNTPAQLLENVKQLGQRINELPAAKVIVPNGASPARSNTPQLAPVAPK